MEAVHAHLPPAHDPFVDLVPPQGIRLTPDHYAYLKISEGCNHRCSFCIIPSLRGDLVSRPIGEVLHEAEVLAEAGVKELLVISQDTSAYGVDVKYRTGFHGGRPVKTRLARTVQGTRQARPLGAPALRLSLSQRRRPDPADGGGQDPALPRRALPARQPAHPQADEAPGLGGKGARPHRRLAPRSAGPGDPLHLHHRLPRRDRGRVQRAARFPRRGAARSRRRLLLFAGRGRQRQRIAGLRCPTRSARNARRACCATRKTFPPSVWSA
jgi:hypothetical protein